MQPRVTYKLACSHYTHEYDYLGDDDMITKENTTDQVEVYPVTTERWDDLETLFGKHGASEDCWCMFWRLRRKDFYKLNSEGRKAGLKEMILENKTPGLLAYINGQVAGWCSVAPREQYIALEYSRKIKRIDDKPVWTIMCFYVNRAYRFRGIMEALVHGAVDYARQNGVKIVEGYPIDMQSPQLSGHKLTGDSGFMGIASIFRRAGFVEVGRVSETQLIMRYIVE
jgi:GNAT superfamily N-acetyltransferase